MNGLLLLADMESLNAFSDLVYEETGIRTEAITMTSAMTVVETIRMVSVGRSLKDVYQDIQFSLESIVRDQFKAEKAETLQRKKVAIVTCFTDKGVAAKLYQRIVPVINQSKVELAQMQFLERESFRKHVDALLEEYEIKAIAGAVDIDHQNISFFSTYDVFGDERLNVSKCMAGDEAPTAKIVDSLSRSLSDVFSIDGLIRSLQKAAQQTQIDLSIIVEPGVDTGIIIHLAFMLDGSIKKESYRQFEKLFIFSKIYRLEMDIVRAGLVALERKYQIEISEDDTALLTQTFLEDKTKK